VSICQVIVNEDRYSAIFFLEALLHDGDLCLGNLQTGPAVPLEGG
jgi:hypothetical protein